MKWFDLSDYKGRIDYLSFLNNASKYLEIGVQKGNTFFTIDLPFKVAVDPCFLFNLEDHQAEGTHYFSVTSDAFFSMLQTENHGLENVIPFDVIFIDGLHTFDQSFRDFENSLNYAHDNTLWLIDDTVPFDAYSAMPDMNTAILKRRNAGLYDDSWHGDVFKTVFAIHDKYPEISYCTLMSGNPQTILWRSKDNKRKPVFGSLQEIAKLNFYDIFENAKLMMPIPNERLADLIGRGIDPLKDADPASWQWLLTYPDAFFKVARHDYLEKNADALL